MLASLGAVLLVFWVPTTLSPDGQKRPLLDRVLTRVGLVFLVLGFCAQLYGAYKPFQSAAGDRCV
jgi:hypothetical protein